MNTRAQQKFDLKQWAKQTNEISPHKQNLFQKVKRCEVHEEEIEEDTRTQTLAFSKLRYVLDDEETKKVPVASNKLDVQENSKKEPLQNEKNQALNQIPNSQKLNYQTKTVNKFEINKKSINKEDASVSCSAKIDQIKKIPEIPYNKKVDEIMQKKPLRDRLEGLLPPDISLPISFDHQELIKRLEIIDRTISFLMSHRGFKIIFFSMVRKSIADSSSIFIEQSTLRQLLYLDSNCYNIEWKMNEKVKKYDIKISLPEDLTSMDSRKIQMRKTIVKHLLAKQAQFLSKIGEDKTQQSSWHPKFEFKKVIIPMANLPVHPSVQNADLRTCRMEEINKVQNPLLKSILRAKKQQSEVKSISKASVADMIFSKIPASQISERLLSTIKEKQKKNLSEVIQIKKIEARAEAQTCLKIARQILMIYMGKNVSNIFKVTLLEMLCQRLREKDRLIGECLNKLIQISDKEEEGNSRKNQKINFLREIESSKKVKVIQMNRQKFRAIEQYLQQQIKDKN